MLSPVCSMRGTGEKVIGNATKRNLERDGSHAARRWLAWRTPAIAGGPIATWFLHVVFRNAIAGPLGRCGHLLPAWPGLGLVGPAYTARQGAARCRHGRVRAGPARHGGRRNGCH